MSSPARCSRRGVRYLALTLLAASIAVVAPSAASSVSAQVGGLGPGGEYVGLTPTRIYDSRSATKVGVPPGPEGPLAFSTSGNTYTVDLLGVGGVPASGVLAVVANVTVQGATRGGTLVVHPAGSTAPAASSVIFRQTFALATMSLLVPGTNGDVSFTLKSTASGTASVIIDVFGYFLTSDSGADPGARLIQTEGRIFDTRKDRPASQTVAHPLIGELTDCTLSGTPGTAQKVQIRGATDINFPSTTVVPDSANITAVVVNLTAINRDAAGDPSGQKHSTTFLSLVPEDPTGTQPEVSHVNLNKDEVIAGLVIVPIGADGSVWLYNDCGISHAVVDVVGYLEEGYDASTRVGRVVPLSAPFRTAETAPIPLGPQQQEPWLYTPFIDSVQVCDSGGSNCESVGSVSALILTLGVVSAQRSNPTVPFEGWLSIRDEQPADPTLGSSNINFRDGETRTNMTVTGIAADGTVEMYSRWGYVDYVHDVAAVVLSD